MATETETSEPTYLGANEPLEPVEQHETVVDAVEDDTAPEVETVYTVRLRDDLSDEQLPDTPVRVEVNGIAALDEADEDGTVKFTKQTKLETTSTEVARGLEGIPILEVTAEVREVKD